MFDTTTVIETKESAAVLAVAYALASCRGHAVIVDVLPHSGYGAKVRPEMFWSGLVTGVVSEDDGCRVELVGGRSLACKEPFSQVLKKIQGE